MKSALELQKNLDDEIFFYMYHMHQDWQSAMKLPIYKRKLYIDKFIEQRERENKAQSGK